MVGVAASYDLLQARGKGLTPPPPVSLQLAEAALAGEMPCGDYRTASARSQELWTEWWRRMRVWVGPVEE